MINFLAQYNSSVVADGVTIDMSVCSGAPTYRASGFIYGLAEDGNQPSADLLADIKIKFLRAGGAQLDAPDGGYVNRKYRRRWNSVLAYYQKAKAAGATLIILIHDLWGADAVCHVPFWPGDNGDWTEFDNFMNRIISDARAAGMTGPDVRWDLWNEPDLSVFWGRSRQQWLDTFKHAYQMLRAAIPGAIIEGPSTASQPNPGNAIFSDFLDFAKANRVIPDIISWHELTGTCDPVIDTNHLKLMLSARDITVSGFDANEYGNSDEQNPGASAWFIARLERANGGIDGLRANWGMHSGLYAGMGDLVNAGWQPAGQYWVYKCYADMTGIRTQVSPGWQVDALAFQDSGAGTMQILLGNRGGTTGTVSVQINHIPAWLVDHYGQVKIRLKCIADGSTYVTGPVIVKDLILTVVDNTIDFSIDWTNARDAYCLTLTP